MSEIEREQEFTDELIKIVVSHSLQELAEYDRLNLDNLDPRPIMESVEMGFTKRTELIMAFAGATNMVDVNSVNNAASRIVDAASDIVLRLASVRSSHKIVMDEFTAQLKEIDSKLGADWEKAFEDVIQNA